jgi:hypothetical protein
MKLSESLVLRRASIYSDPGNTNSPLPLVYGHLTDGEAGISPCVEIQKWNGSSAVFLIADHAIKNTAPTVYVDDIEAPSGWTFSASNDFESQGPVATLTFSVDVSGHNVSVKCQGKEDAVTSPIENLAHIIYDIAFTKHGLGIEEWNNPKYVEAFQLCSGLGYSYVGGGIISQDAKLVDIAQSILAPIGGAYVDRDAKLTLYVENITPPSLVEDFFEDSDIDSFQLTTKLDGLANEIMLKARKNWRKAQFMSQEETFDYELTAGDTQSQLESKVRHKDIEIPWLRTEAAVQSATNAMLALWSKPRWRIRIVLNGFRGMNLKPGQAIAFKHQKLPSAGTAYRLLRIQQINVGWMNGKVTLSGFDLGDMA